MSWNVPEDDWLAEPTAIPGSGPMDALDGQVISAIGVMPPSVPPVQAAAPVVSAPTLPPMESLPPPPTSAAFEPHERPSYESGGFVADPPAVVEAPEEAPPIEAPASAGAAEPLDFHIPTLAFGVQAPSAPAVEPPAPAPASEEPAGLVIPTLSRMKWVPAAAAPADAPTTGSVGASVYDDDDAQEVGHPELLEQVDSAELELVATEDGAGQDRQDEAPEVAFVIPTLARPDATERLDISLEPAGGRDEMVIPMLMRAEPVLAPEPEVGPYTPAPDLSAGPLEPPPDEPSADAREPDAREPDAPIVEHSDDVEEFEEVEADAIESLDVADLVETEAESDAALETSEPEAKPRAQPPDAKPQQKRRKAWYDDVFAEHFSFLFPPTWDETAQRDAQFIHDQLGLREGASVLDVGCGDGHHAIALAKLGLNVTGVDNSLAMLLAAAAHKDAAGIDDQRVTFLHGDMRRLPRDREFEAVICVGTTFGYFEEEQNRQCLHEMFDRLAVGGRILLHVFNRDFVAPHLPSRSWWQGRRCMVIDEAEMNFFANRLRVHRTIIFDDGRQYEHFMFMRAYTVQDLGKAMSSLGMRVVEVSGSRDTRARFYGSASPDIWMLAERK